MTKTANIVIETASSSEDSFVEVFGLLLDLHKAGGYAALDVSEASANAYRVISEGMTFVAKINGEAVGTLAFTDVQFWYSKTRFLQDAWFFVKPEFRRGKVGVKLLQAGRDEAAKRGKIAFVTINNPDRKPKRTVSALESQTVGFVPLGYTLKMR